VIPLDRRVHAWRRVASRFQGGLEGPRWVTRGLFLVCLVLHLSSGLLDLHTGRAGAVEVVVGGRSDEALTALGARVTRLVNQGEVWRILTMGLLHGNAAHLFFNLLALSGLGRLAETVFGPRRALFAFLLSVTGGGVASQLWGGPLSVGASGGIFGLMGAIVAFALRRRRILPPRLRDGLSRDLIPWIALNLGIGLLVPAVDNQAHAGGLLTGIVLGLVLADRITDGRRTEHGFGGVILAVDVVLLLVAAAGIGLSLGSHGAACDGGVNGRAAASSERAAGVAP
jgi:membrane associated rhomboid family serine protease